jgi:magnesium-transporting ATPase (P-type)
MVRSRDFKDGLGDEETASIFMSALALSNDAQSGDGGDTLLGDPTETALFDIARKKRV